MRTFNHKKILFLGDSITFQGGFIQVMKDYCQKFLRNACVDWVNEGLSSETVSNLSEPDHNGARPCLHSRLNSLMHKHNPDYVIACYGMNDAIYHPYSAERAMAFKKGIISLISSVHSFGAEVVLLTPVAFDKNSFKGELKKEDDTNFSYMKPYEKYDEVLKKYSSWLMSLDQEVYKVIDLHSKLNYSLEKHYDNNNEYSSGDGIHPNEEIHFEMASIIIKELFNISLSSYNGYKSGFAKWEEKYHDFEAEGFYFSGRECILVKPKKTLKNNPWIFRTEFFGRFDKADRALLEKGYHLAYIRLCDMFGSNQAVYTMYAFQSYLCMNKGLCKKTNLFGFSRGGLYAFNYAAMYPDAVDKIYFDAPVLDIRSWPRGMYSGNENLDELEMLLDMYQISRKELLEYEVMTKEKIDRISSHEIKILIVAGDLDETVPYSENGEVLVKKYPSDLMKVIIKQGCGHHPHSLDDVSEIVSFID